MITRMLADRTGLTGELSDALARPDVIHDRGRVLADLSLAMADGATSISDIGVLGDQQRIFGPGGVDLDGVADPGRDRRSGDHEDHRGPFGPARRCGCASRPGMVRFRRLPPATATSTV
ncbi:hypothetical protein [Mycobacterium sp.]|uniref:hypothetical protein n=1 Tax=Mycobacterium sp. TaxID=1785 RepID=UPI0031E0B6A2